MLTSVQKSLVRTVPLVMKPPNLKQKAADVTSKDNNESKIIFLYRLAEKSYNPLAYQHGNHFRPGLKQALLVTHKHLLIGHGKYTKSFPFPSGAAFVFSVSCLENISACLLSEVQKKKKKRVKGLI